MCEELGWETSGQQLLCSCHSGKPQLKCIGWGERSLTSREGSLVLLTRCSSHEEATAKSLFTSPLLVFLNSAMESANFRKHWGVTSEGGTSCVLACRLGCGRPARQGS